MLAFSQGLGLRHFHGYVPDEMPSVLWDGEDVNESWKDFVELARASGAAFLTMNSVQLESDDVELLMSELHHSNFSRERGPGDGAATAQALRTDRIYPARLSPSGRDVSLRAFDGMV